MPRYNYKCYEGCTHPDYDDISLIWEEVHGMHEDVDIKCPLCGEKAGKTFEGMDFHFYFRGNGYLDTDGCRRDMDLYKLTQDDPYGEYRQPGEADYLADNLKKKGKKQKDTQYFIPKKVIHKNVKK